MDKLESQQSAAEFMRLAIPLMNKYGISVLPENYAVWYQYVSGENADLTQAIDDYLQSHASIDDKVTYDFYQRFVGPDKDQSQLLALRQSLRSLVEEALEQTTAGVSAASGLNGQMADIRGIMQKTDWYFSCF